MINYNFIPAIESRNSHHWACHCMRARASCFVFIFRCRFIQVEMSQCKYFLRGNCRFGDNCRFSHVTATEAQTTKFTFQSRPVRPPIDHKYKYVAHPAPVSSTWITLITINTRFNRILRTSILNRRPHVSWTIIQTRRYLNGSMRTLVINKKQ